MKVLLALLLPACAAPALPTYEYDAIAVDLAASLNVDRLAFGVATDVAHGLTVRGFGADGSAVTGTEYASYADVDISFLLSCAPGCDPQTAHTAVTYASAGTATVLGTVVPTSSLATITHNGSWTLDAIGSGVDSIAGSTTFNDDTTVDGVSYQFAVTATYALEYDDSFGPPTTGGTVALDISASEAGSAGATTFSAKGTGMFANDVATLLLDDSRSYAIDFTSATVGSD